MSGNKLDYFIALYLYDLSAILINYVLKGRKWYLCVIMNNVKADPRTTKIQFSCQTDKRMRLPIVCSRHAN